MTIWLVASLLIFAAHETQKPTISEQRSSGWCSPNIANVIGNVKVTCIGIDPRALQRLSDKLSKSNLKLEDMTREAKSWVARYQELEAQLADSGSSDARSQQAENLLHEGDLEGAAALIDKILADGDNAVMSLAAKYFERALISELLFRQGDAIPFLKKAYGLADTEDKQPEKVKYGIELARDLADTGQYQEASDVLRPCIQSARQLSDGGDVDLQQLSVGLNNLANLDSRNHATDAAESEYKESISISEKLNQTGDNGPYWASINNLGKLYDDTHRPSLAIAEYKRALEPLQEASKINPLLLPELGTVLNNLAAAYHSAHDLGNAESFDLQAFTLRQQLAKSNSNFLPDVAASEQNLGLVEEDLNKYVESEVHLKEAADIYRRVDASGPPIYRGDLAIALIDLGNFYRDHKGGADAAAVYTEAQGLYTDLVASDPGVYDPYQAILLNNFARYQRDTNDKTSAEANFMKVLDIRLRLVKTNPGLYRVDLAETYRNLAMLHTELGRKADANQEATEAVRLNEQDFTSDPKLADDLANGLIIELNTLPAGTEKCMLSRRAAEVSVGARDPYYSEASKYWVEHCDKD